MKQAYYFDDEPHARVFARNQERAGCTCDVFEHADGLEWVVEVQRA